jgi:hypothetical protein
LIEVILYCYNVEIASDATDEVLSAFVEHTDYCYKPPKLFEQLIIVLQRHF